MIFSDSWLIRTGFPHLVRLVSGQEFTRSHDKLAIPNAWFACGGLRRPLYDSIVMSLTFGTNELLATNRPSLVATRFCLMAIGSRLLHLSGYPFEVRYSEGALARAQAAAVLAADAYGYFSRLFSEIEPDIAVIVANEADWESRQPYGLPFFNDDKGQIRPGIVVMPVGSGDFWTGMGEDLRDASKGRYAKLLAAYPDGAGGLNLQPFFDLITIHELGHAFEVLGDLRLPTFWLGEIFANLALHAFVATKRPESLRTLEVLSTVGAQSSRLDARTRAVGYTTLDEVEVRYTGGDDPMSPLNYVWYQYRWQRLAATMFDSDGEEGLVRYWNYFHAIDRLSSEGVTAALLAPLLRTEVSETLGRAVQDWPTTRSWMKTD